MKENIDFKFAGLPNNGFSNEFVHELMRFQNFFNLIYFENKLAENNADFEKILKRETEVYNKSFGKNLTTNEFKEQLIFELSEKIFFFKSQKKFQLKSYELSKDIRLAEQFINYLQNRKDDNLISEKLELIKSILPKANEIIFENATIEDFENILRRTPPNLNNRIKKRKNATAYLLYTFFNKLCSDFEIVEIFDNEYYKYFELGEGGIRSAKSKNVKESERVKIKRLKKLNEIFKPIQK